MKEVLVHCLQLQKWDLVKFVLDALDEKPIYVHYVFELAEQLQEQGAIADLSVLYEYILDHEANLHSERFTVSQYRLFRIHLGLDLHKSFKSAIRFAPYRHALPLHLKLDALAQLIHVAFALRDWDLLKQYGEELSNIALIVYQAVSNKQDAHIQSYERPLIVYYGKGYIAQCAALESIGEYTAAKKMIAYFEDLSWFEGLDHVARVYVEKYAVWARCHRYNIELLQGNYSVLHQYVNFLEFFPEEHPASIDMILKASNLHKWNIDELLQKYHHTIYPPDIWRYLESNTNYAMMVETSRYINIYYELAVYYFERKKSSAQLEHILYTLKNNVEKYNRIYTFNSTELFEKLYKFYF
ncbi:hypothetical protein [Paenibacillus campi]|uniref:hypothetical protein n=1 Tax=Paenibacillus campi TaxID=3106031 RepID=UPI002AFEA006|nr:hypothetical protein [Paenibacillus sp. SGZ-1014]